MKIRFIILTLTVIYLGCKPETRIFTNGTDDYFILDNNPSKKRIYSYMNGQTFTDYFLDEMKTINGNQYFTSIRVYSRDNIDTTYYRQTSDNFVFVNTDNFIESIDIPKKPFMGQKWEEPDGNWIYEIKSIDGKLTTPTKTYENLVEIEAKQRTGETKHKLTQYNNFYAKGIGYVASKVDGQLFSYLKTIEGKDD
jgi:hypothetical protein